MAQHVTAAAPDVQQLPVVVAAITAGLHRKPKHVLADAGYWSEANAQLLEGKHIAAYIATTRQPHGERLAPAPRKRPPKDLSVRDRMARTLRTVAGRAVYACRKKIAEPVFGQIKHARGFRQFLRRGLRHVGEEWALICTAHNLLKLFAARAVT